MGEGQGTEGRCDRYTKRTNDARISTSQDRCGAACAVEEMEEGAEGRLGSVNSFPMIVELEGLLRHIYRRDTRANKLRTPKDLWPVARDP